MTAISPCGMVARRRSCGVDVSGKWSGVLGGDVHGQIWAFRAQRAPVPYTVSSMYRAATCGGASSGGTGIGSSQRCSLSRRGVEKYATPAPGETSWMPTTPALFGLGVSWRQGLSCACARSHVITTWTILPSLLVDMKHGQATQLVMRCDVQMIRLFPHPTIPHFLPRIRITVDIGGHRRRRRCTRARRSRP